jgi:hypothetical protein
MALHQQQTDKKYAVILSGVWRVYATNEVEGSAVAFRDGCGSHVE